MNLYAYCGNNPVNMFDETGCFPWFIIASKKAKKGRVSEWAEDNILSPIKTFVGEIVEDVNNYDLNNTSESKVFASNYFSCYKGVFVLKTPFDASFSFGFIGLSSSQQNSNTLNHEYGHYLQLQQMGWGSYLTYVAIPSLATNMTHRLGQLPGDYYGAPWEAEADALGGVERLYNNTPWSLGKLEQYDGVFRWIFEYWMEK